MFFLFNVSVNSYKKREKEGKKEKNRLTFNLNATFQVNATHNKLTAKIIACISG